MFKSSLPRPKDLAFRQLFTVVKPRRLPSFKQWMHIGRVLGPLERHIFVFLFLVFFCSVFTAGYLFVSSHLKQEPALGGSYTEGVIGEPQFINPLYASQSSDIDRDLTRLLFSGLLQIDDHGTLLPDLAKEWSVSPDGLTYTFTLQDTAVFHNEEPVRAADVIFTITALQNPLFGSPLASRFADVSVAQVDEKTLTFTLKEPNALFPYALTVGILPSDAWANVSPSAARLSKLNLTNPIGTGPYRLQSYKIDKNNLLSYTLVPFEHTLHPLPHIKELTFKFYPDTDTAVSALKKPYIEGLASLPNDQISFVTSEKNLSLYTPFQSRQTVLYFNTARKPLSNIDLRKALTLGTIRDTLRTRADDRMVWGPFLPESPFYQSSLVPPSPDIAEANRLLDTLGYAKKEGMDQRFASKELAKKGDVSGLFTLHLVTLDSPEFQALAQVLIEQWKSLGLTVDLRVVSEQEFLSDILKSHDYDILLYGAYHTPDRDPSLFWHTPPATSSGVNFSLYSNLKVDEVLEKARQSKTQEERVSLMHEFQTLLVNDYPAIFLSQSTYPYAVASKIKNVTFGLITQPSDRFAHIENWYIETHSTFSWE